MGRGVKVGPAGLAESHHERRKKGGVAYSNR